MRHMLKLICWMTLFVDVCLILGSAFHGVFGDGNPVATMRIGEFAVTSAMTGGATFLIVVSAWTGVLAGAGLVLDGRAARRRRWTAEGRSQVSGKSLGGRDMTFSSRVFWDVINDRDHRLVG